MTEDRPAIPAAIKREVMLEAGHRCAIPTCRSTEALELAHIVPWSQVQKHEFWNLILLCAICHYRYDNGRIDRKSVYAYKANLATLNSRYGEFERRVLQWFSEDPGLTYLDLERSNETRLNLSFLLRDGLVGFHELGGATIELNGYQVGAKDRYQLTEAGREFVASLNGADPVSTVSE